MPKPSHRGENQEGHTCLLRSCYILVGLGEVCGRFIFQVFATFFEIVWKAFGQVSVTFFEDVHEIVQILSGDVVTQFS